MESREKLDQAKFLQLMAAYASIQTYRAPDFEKREVGWYYYQEFKFRSLDDLRIALDTHIKNHDHFPSIRELNLALSGGVDDDTLSRIVAMNILGAIQKFGYCNWPEAKEYIGEVGVKIVDRFGGWPNVCEMLTMDNFSYMQNQIREATKSYLAAGVVVNDQHALPQAKKTSDLINSLCKTLEIKAKDPRAQISEKITDLSKCLTIKEDELPW